MIKGIMIQWDTDEVLKFIYENGYDFARYKTPHGLPAKLMKIFKRKLQGKCFSNAIVLAKAHSHRVWYCEGFAAGIPHAWVCPKEIKGKYNDTWIIDPTWRWKNNGTPQDKYQYIGIRFDGFVAMEMLAEYQLDYCKKNGGWTRDGGLSLLSNPEILNKSYPGFGETYGF